MAKAYEIKLRVDANGKAAVTELTRVEKKVGDVGKSAKRATSEADILTRGFASMGKAAGAALGAIGFGALVRGFVSVSAEQDRFRRGFEAISASSAAAAAELAYVSEVSARLGLEVSSATTAYLSLTAASRGTALQGEASRKIFESVSLAMGKLGKSAYDTQGALLAVEQMISKGTVQAEELRGQLGERLPGAFQAAANAMGVTTEELGKLLQTGQVTANDLLPKLADELNRLYDDGSRVGGLASEWNRFTSAMREFATSVNEATGALGFLEGILRSATNLASSLGNALDGLGFQNLAGSQSEFNVLMQQRLELIERFEQQSKRVAELSGRSSALEALFPQLPRAQSELRATAQALGELEQKMARMQQGNVDLAKSQNEATSAAEKASVARKDYGETLTGEAAIVADLERQYGLLRGQLDAIWSMESSRGKTAGVDSSRLVKDLAAGKGAVTEIVGEFQMARATAQGLGADMSSFKGQAEGAAKYLQEAAQKGLSLWEQFAYYHGGPNKAAWGERTKAYADQAVKLVEQAGGAMRSLSSATSKAIDADQKKMQRAMDAAIAKANQLAREYIPGRAAAEDYAQAQAALAVAVTAQKVSQEDATKILAAMTAEQAKAAAEAKPAASAWGKMWENAVERVDDAFAQLWVDLISGGKSALDTLKTGIMRWLAEMAHAMITRPLVVAITGVGAAGGATQAAAGAVQQQTGGLFSGGGLSSIVNMFSSNSMGTSIGIGIAKGLGSLGISGNWIGSGVAGLASTPNWALGGGALAGGLLGNALFGSQGYGSIGSSIGSTAGSVIGAMISPLLGPLAPLGPILGGLLGGTGGGFLGSLFGGEKEDPRATLGINNGTWGLKSTNGRWDDNGDLAKAMMELNKEFDSLAGALGQGAWEARQAFSHPGQELTPENVEKWISDMTQQMLKAMVNGAKNEAVQNAGSLLLADIMTYAFERAGDDPQAMLGALQAAKAMHAMIFSAVKTMFDFERDPAVKNPEQAANALWSLAKEMNRAGEAMDQTLSRVLNNIQAAQAAFELVGQSLDDIKLSPEDMYKTVARQIEVETPQVSQATSFFTQMWGQVEELLSSQELSPKVQFSVMEAVKNHPFFGGKFSELLGQVEYSPEIGSRLEEVLKSHPLFGNMYNEVVSQFETDPRPSNIMEILKKLHANAASTGQELKEIETVYEQVMLTEQEIATLMLKRRAEIGEKLAEYAGGMEALQAGMATYYENFFTEEERRAKQVESAMRTIELEAKAMGYTLEQVPRTKDEFRNLVESLNLTTESGQRMFAKLMELSGAFALVYESMEALKALAEDVGKVIGEIGEEGAMKIAELLKSLKPGANGSDAWEELDTWMRSLGIETPRTSEAMYALLTSGRLTSVQMLALAERSDDLRAAFAYLEEGLSGWRANVQTAISDLERSVAAEKEAINATYQARVDALNAEKEAANLAHSERIAALNDERTAAQEAAQEVGSVLSSITSALSSFRGTVVDEFSRAAASAMLADWARSGQLPSSEDLNRVLAAATSGAPEQFRTAADYAAYQKSTMANLIMLERSGQSQLSAAEQTVQAIDARIEQANKQHEQYIGFLDQQIQQAAEWRDDELGRLDQIVEDAKRAAEIALGTYRATVSVEEAMRAVYAVISGQPGAAPWDGPVEPPGGWDAGPVAQRETTAEVVELRTEVALLRESLTNLGVSEAASLKSIDDRLLKWELQSQSGEGPVTVVRAS